MAACNSLFELVSRIHTVWYKLSIRPNQTNLRQLQGWIEAKPKYQDKHISGKNTVMEEMDWRRDDWMANIVKKYIGIDKKKKRLKTKTKESRENVVKKDIIYFASHRM